MKIFKYQLSKIFPHNKVIKVAPIKNGPKGISDFKVFFFKINKTIATIAPIKKAKNKAVRRNSHPKSKPINAPILISPTPIHLPFDIKTIIKKNPPPTKAARK